MRWLNNQVRFGMAAVLLSGGAVWGAYLYQDDPAYDRAQARQIRQLAERVRNQPSAAAPTLTSAALPAAPSAAPRDEKPQVRVRSQPDHTGASKAAPASTPAAAPAAPEDPVKNIALMGVTQQGEEGRAWLVDLENHTREVVGEGEEAFGFTVKEIDGESVLLSRGAQTFSLHLGEKQIPPAPGSTETTAAEASSPGAGFGFGGGGGDDRKARFAGMMAQMSGSPGGGGRSWGGSSPSWSSNQSGRSFSGGGGFSPANIPWGLMAGGNGQSNNQNRNLNRPTSNPQEARRRKSRLVGGADAIAEPDPFNNPQTLRRLGRSTGQAFGASNNGNNQNRR